MSDDDRDYDRGRDRDHRRGARHDRPERDSSPARRNSSDHGGSVGEDRQHDPRSRRRERTVATLFVAEIPPAVAEEDFNQLFERFEGFVGARLRNDRTGATVGFADFSVDEGASAAMAQLQGHKFDASQNEGLHLCRAKSSGSARSAQPLMNQSMFGAGAATTSTILSNTSMITHPYLSGHRVRPVTLYVEGVPDDATLREVKHLFRPFPTFKSLRLRKPEGPQRKKTLCFVEFGNEYDARQAMQVLNGYCFQDDDPSSGRLMIAFAKSN